MRVPHPAAGPRARRAPDRAASPLLSAPTAGAVPLAAALWPRARARPRSLAYAPFPARRSVRRSVPPAAGRAFRSALGANSTLTYLNLMYNSVPNHLQVTPHPQPSPWTPDPHPGPNFDTAP